MSDEAMAFPGKRLEYTGVSTYQMNGEDPVPQMREVFDPGMTLRDWFAGQALVGALFGAATLEQPAGTDEHSIARVAYKLADAMLAEREKKA